MCKIWICEKPWSDPVRLTGLYKPSINNNNNHQVSRKKAGLTHKNAASLLVSIHAPCALCHSVHRFKTQKQKQNRKTFVFYIKCKINRAFSNNSLNLEFVFISSTCWTKHVLRRLWLLQMLYDNNYSIYITQNKSKRWPHNRSYKHPLVTQTTDLNKSVHKPNDMPSDTLLTNARNIHTVTHTHIHHRIFILWMENSQTLRTSNTHTHTHTRTHAHTHHPPPHTHRGQAVVRFNLASNFYCQAFCRTRILSFNSCWGPYLFMHVWKLLLYEPREESQLFGAQRSPQSEEHLD